MLPSRRRARTRRTTPPRGGSTLAVMAARFAFALFVLLAACSIQPDLEPPPQCSLPMPDGGERCSCPGTSAQIFNPPVGCPPFMCRSDGTWAPYDAACLTSAGEAGPLQSDAGFVDATGDP